MSMAEVMELAEGVAAQRIKIENMMIMNRPTDIEARIKLDASLMVARDLLRILELGYDAALRLLADGAKA